MSNSADALVVRWVTALAIVCVCSLSVLWGWKAARFALARDRVVAGPGRNDILREWVSVPGLGMEAREAPLRTPSDQSSSTRLTRLASVLDVHPMSVEDWTAFAADDIATRKPQGDINTALQMSWVTGPNEGRVMWERALAGLLEWDALPSEAHREVAADLAGAMLGDAIDDQTVELAAAIIGRKQVSSQKDIVTQLRIAGVPARDFRKLGLESFLD